MICLALIWCVTALMAGQPPAQSATWDPPNPDTLPSGVWKNTVLYGRSLFSETYRYIGPEVRDKAMRFSGNNLSCQSCHLNAGTQKFGMPMVGIYALFPTYMGRENDVRTIEDRIQGCMERSMNGRPLPEAGREMKAMVAYIQFLSTGVAIGKTVEGRGTPALPLLDRAANPARGAIVYAEKCVVCHQADGQGLRRGPRGDAGGYLYPPLWGPDTFNNGAGMHRLISAANFIRANMPFGTKYDAPVLSVDEAWDVAAFVNSHPRPVRPNLDRDYPDRSRKPVDAPFGPFNDAFPLEQHKLGPFKPILAAQSARPGGDR